MTFELSKPNKSLSKSPWYPALGNANSFEVCERRLVLSAQLLLDVVGDPTLQQHQLSAPNALPALELHAVPPTDPVDLPLESHLQEAHAASGWNQVQQQFGLTGSGQTVAVIDSGIAWDHVALGQGYGPGYRVVGGWDFTEENDAQPYDDGPAGFHGTHVAGIIGSSSSEHPGVAPDADLVALRVFNDMGQGQLSWVEKALQWVHSNKDSFENPITTVNLSLGTTWNADVIPNWATLEEEFQQLANDGITVVASAGNSFAQYNAPGLSYPAASPNVLPVASVGDDGELSDFSQRNGRVLAAPGEQIMSSVPDHVFGRDGIVNDFSGASGTSMAAPYVAGAAVLVRQAMEMVDFGTINMSTISQHLHATADSVFDSATGAFYDRLNLANAIDTLIPDDTIGDQSSAAAAFSLDQTQIDGWINNLGDRDLYRFTATTSGTLQIDADSQWAETLGWTLSAFGGGTLASGGLEAQSVNIAAGQTYELLVASPDRIGSFSIDVGFTANPTNGGGAGESSGNSGSSLPNNLGAVDYLEESLAAGSKLRVQATQDGTFTVQWNNSDAATGGMTVRNAGNTFSDSTWEGGELRIDLEVRAGDWLDVSLPGHASDTGDLALANVLTQSATQVNIHGTLANDQLAINLQNGLKIDFGAIDYSFASGQVTQVSIDGYANNDSLVVVGSAQSDKVELTPTHSSIENSQVRIDIASVENISFSSGGGPDRVYLYDSDTDDTLTARPRQAELVGVGYRFEVSDVERIFMHATGGGQDYAYLYDSAGDDRLSVRPQFTSLSGEGFFNYVRGFERVYAYANAGGVDQADLYDSAANDRFTANGASASIVGPGFSSYTRSFEQVNAHSTAGGADLATLYGSNAQTNWQSGNGFVGFREDAWSREARGFEQVQTYVAGQAHAMSESSRPATMSDNTLPNAKAESSNLMAEAGPTPPLDLSFPAVSYQTSEFATAAPEHDVVYEPFDHENHFDARDWAKDDAEIHGIAYNDIENEMSLLREAVSLREWLMNRAPLPEEAILNDPDLELELLDKIFHEHEELID